MNSEKKVAIVAGGLRTSVRTIRWGIIGCGDVTEVKSGPGFRQAINSDLVAVMRRDGSKAADYAARHNVARWYDNVDELLGDPNVDAIYIATPTAAHLDNVLSAAETGKPILVEKPMGLNEGECRRMIAACEASGSPLFLAYYRRALPRYQRLLEIISSGRIGAPRCVSVRHFQTAEDLPDAPWKIDPKANGGGFFADTQVHVIDWLDQAFGPVVNASGVATNQAGLSEAEDTVSASLTFSSGVIANFLCCYVSDHREESVTIIGDRGSVSMSFFSPTPIRVETNEGVVDYITVEETQPVHRYLIQQIVDHLNGGPEPSSTADNGLRATIVLDNILASYRRALDV